jgi:hypothetical protein
MVIGPSRTTPSFCEEKCHKPMDIERVIVERNIAYRVWKRRHTIADRKDTKFKEVYTHQINSTTILLLELERQQQNVYRLNKPAWPGRLLFLQYL